MLIFSLLTPPGAAPARPYRRAGAAWWFRTARVWAGALLVAGAASAGRAQPPAPATVFTTANSPLPDNAVSALCYDAARARLWVGTDYGLARLELAGPGTPVWTVYHAAPGGLPDDAIRAVALADSTGAALWVGTFRGGLARLTVATGAWEQWSAATSPLPLDQVRAVAAEPDGGVWIGTAGGLAHRSAAGAWRVFTPFNSALPSGNVAALVRNPVDSTLWGGTVNGGLVRVRRGVVRAYTLAADNLPDNTVLALALDSLRRPLLGTAAAGLVRYLTDSTWAAYGPLTSANPAATVLAVTTDSAGRWWLGSAEHGLVGWERGRFTPFAFGSRAGLPDSTVRAVAVGSGGALWLGLRSGGLAWWRPGPLGGAAGRGAQPAVRLLPSGVGAGLGARVRVVGGAGGSPFLLIDARGAVVVRGTLAEEAPAEAGVLVLPPLPPGLYTVRCVVAARWLSRRLLVE